MDLRATIRLKVEPIPALKETMQEFSRAAQYSYDYALANRIYSWKLLHQRLYQDLKARFKLPSQLTCKAIKFALETKKGCRNRKVDFSRELAIPYDHRSYSFRFSGHCSLSTLSGRYKAVLHIPEYYRKTYKDWNVRSATLCRKGKDIFLNVVVARKSNPVPFNPNAKIVGVDLGINNLAVTSDRQFFRGVNRPIARFQRLRARLQSKGTKSAQKHLRKLRGRQTRFMRSTNHEISKRIVSQMQEGDTVVMEDLHGITARRKGRELNRLLHTWAFDQLRGFVEYKAAQRGITLVTVSPAYSSQACSRCHEIISIRPGKAGFFKCLNCGYSCNADLNASLNLRKRVDAWRNILGLFVNQPIVGNNHQISSDKPMPLGMGS